MAALFTDDFTGANGAAWNAAKWTTDLTATAIDIQSNEGRCAFGTAAGLRARAISTMSAVGDCELLMKVRFDNVTGSTTRCYIRPWIRANGTWAATAQPVSGYGIEVQSDSATITLFKCVGGTPTTLGTGTGPSATTTARWVRLRAEGTTISVRVWLDGSPEPATWTAQATGQTDVASGTVQLATRNSSGADSPNAVRVDDLTVSDLTVGPVAPAVHQRIVGIPSATSVPLKVKTADASSVRLKVGTDAAVSQNVVWSAAVAPDAEGLSSFTLTGLPAAPRYYYQVAVTDAAAAETLDSFIGEFKLAPAGQTSFAFSFASCSDNSSTTAAAAIAARRDDFFLHLGDFYYADNTGTDLTNFRSKFDARLQSPDYNILFATAPTSLTPNDHDGMTDGSYGGANGTAWTNWNQVFRERIPTLDLPGGSTGAYRTWTWGRVRFIQWDGRSFRTSSGGTMLGATQKQWIKDVIDAAAEPVIVIVQGDPWIGASGSSDTWPNYPAERTELGNFFAASGKGIVMLGGDMHALAADDGTNAPGGIAVFQAAPMSQSASIKGGPYSAGTYPTVAGASVQQYGRCVVTDTGSSISLAYTGYSADGTQRITLTATTAVDDGRVVDRWNGTALVRQRTDRWNGTALVQQTATV